MKRLIVGLVALTLASVARADTFGTGENVFDIDFVPISGDASSANGTNISQFEPSDNGYKIFADPGGDYRMGVYEITNDQWDKFVAIYGTPTGDPSATYNARFSHRGTGTTDVPTSNVSWYKAAQMVNWLNTSTDHLPAYKFTGTQGEPDYALDIWSPTEAAGGTNLYRHKDAFYFLPTEDEWVKAAYWNGSDIQQYATKPADTLHQGDGTSGTGWNYVDGGLWATDPPGPWDVGSGSEELNGTYDMMGNVYEWMESPLNDPSYGVGSYRGMRGGFWHSQSYYLHAFGRNRYSPSRGHPNTGFRVASVPEPGSITLLVCGAIGLLAYGWRRRKA